MRSDDESAVAGTRCARRTSATHGDAGGRDGGVADADEEK